MLKARTVGIGSDQFKFSFLLLKEDAILMDDFPLLVLHCSIDAARTLS